MPTLKRPLRGGERGTDVTMVQRALNKALDPNGVVDGRYGPKTQNRMAAFQRSHLIHPDSGFLGMRTLNVLWLYFDPYGKARYVAMPAPLPNPLRPWGHVGAVTKRRWLPVIWDKSLLDYSLTHASGGLPENAQGITLWPAVDLAWGAGVSMYAPEGCVVDTQDSSARPGEALYLTLDCRLRIWMAHIDRDYGLGHRFSKGEFIARTVDTHLGGGPHGHIGVNGEAFLGRGKQFRYGRNGTGPDYTTGSETIREQLELAQL